MIPRVFLASNDTSFIAEAVEILESIGYEVLSTLDNVGRESISSCHVFVLKPPFDPVYEEFAHLESKFVVSVGVVSLPLNIEELSDKFFWSSYEKQKSALRRSGILAHVRSMRDLVDVAKKVKPLCRELLPVTLDVAEQLACIQATHPPLD